MALLKLLYKRIVIKFFWTIVNIVGYVIGKRVVIELLRTVFKFIILIFFIQI